MYESTAIQPLKVIEYLSVFGSEKHWFSTVFLTPWRYAELDQKRPKR